MAVGPRRREVTGGQVRRGLTDIVKFRVWVGPWQLSFAWRAAVPAAVEGWARLPASAWLHSVLPTPTEPVDAPAVAVGK